MTHPDSSLEALLAVLVKYADAKTGKCWPTLKTLVADLNNHVPIHEVIGNPTLMADPESDN